MAATQRADRFQEAPHPATVLIPGTASAAASAASASRSRISAEISGSPERSMSTLPGASSRSSGRPQYLSSGTARAIATQRSVSALRPAGVRSAPETCACCFPKMQRRATLALSSRSMLSSFPSRTDTLTPSATPILASAAVAPALRQLSSNPASRSAGGTSNPVMRARWTAPPRRATALRQTSAA